MKTHRILLVVALFTAACSSPSVGARSGRSDAEWVGIPFEGSTTAAQARGPWLRDDAVAEDAGTASNGAARAYPAFTPDTPRLTSSGGPVLTSPRVVTVTWDGDPERPTYEALAASFGSTSYGSVLHEWGVGPATDGAHVHVAAAFDMTYETLTTYIQTKVDGAPASGWPANTDQTVYAVYVPASATQTFTMGGQPFCDTGVGLHSATTPPAEAGATRPVVFALTVDCGGGAWGADNATVIATESLAGAFTDPYPETNPSYRYFDPNHVAWDVLLGMQTEVGQAAGEYFEAYDEEPPPFSMAVSRLWSGAALAAGHDALVPVTPGETYYNVTTLPGQLEAISVDLSDTGLMGTVQTRGIKVALGASRTFDVGFYSDGPTADWALSAIVAPTLPIVDTSGNPLPNGAVDVTIDQPTGANGHVAHVTVTPRSKSSAIGAEFIELQSGNAQAVQPHVLPILIAQ
jgi:hypothetical protein